MQMQLANQYFQAGRLDQARAMCAQVLQSNRNDIRAIEMLIRIYYRLEQTGPLVDMLRRAHELDPGNNDILFRFGMGLRDQGNFDEARQAFVELLSRQPKRADAFYNLAMMTKFTTRNDEVKAMETLFAEQQQDPEGRRQLAFGLGKIFDDLGDFDRAFGYFQEGNRIADAANRVSHQSDERMFAAIHSVFDTAFLNRHRDVGVRDNTPIFVTGMPRSGTTLVEQILASHPLVFGGGERNLLPGIVEGLVPNTRQNPFPNGFETIDSSVFAGGAQTYIDGLKKIADDESRVTDKTITNFLYIALIAVMMPDAIIINCQRDPRDQCLSIYQKDLRQQLYSFDLARIGRNYRMFYSLFEYWDRLLPGKIFRLHYEDLVREPDTMVSNLLEHCGLPFDDACMAFHQTDRNVRTMSLTQVRKPLYTDAIGRWKNYAQHLAPLMDALGPDWSDSAGGF
jgi:tetratricopeptide (TPR) repeat protein